MHAEKVRCTIRRSHVRLVKVRQSEKIVKGSTSVRCFISVLSWKLRVIIFGDARGFIFVSIWYMDLLLNPKNSRRISWENND